MNSTRKSGGWKRQAAAMILLATPLLNAQQAARLIGAITAVNGNTLSVRTDAGDLHQVIIPASLGIRRVVPGQHDLSAAAALQLTDLAAGDRVLIKLDAAAPNGTEEAAQIIAIKAADVQAQQQHEREDWQRRGVGGIVKTVDAASNTITLSSASKTITVHLAPTTSLKRYAPGSIRFDLAQKAPVDAIHVGDQLRARGTKNADGTDITADDVISGSFRNVSGLITAIDPAAGTIALKDLTTKKPIVVHIGNDVQMRRIPDMMAQMIAARLKGSAAGNASHMPPAGAGRWGAANPAAGNDPQQALSHAPAIQITDLKKGEAIMVVATDGTTDVAAITLLAGVEPLLEAPAASNLLSNWSMGSGGGEGAQ